MKIGIIGSGNIGSPLGRLWAAAGHEVMFSSRHPESLDALATQAGDNASCGSIDQAIAFADTLFEAIPYAAVMQLSPEAYAGKTLISASNYYPERDGDIELDGRSQSEALAARLPETTVIKAFNMMFATEMEARANGETDERLAIFHAGDDVAAMDVAGLLISAAKFVPVDGGSLAEGRRFESGAPLYAQRMSEAEARNELDALRHPTRAK